MGEVMSIWNPKKNVLFDASMSKVKELSKSINNLNTELIQNKWFRIIPDDPKSPMIMGMGDNKHLIYYPPNSTPYLHQYEKSIKFVEILSGELFDLLTDKVFKQGDRVKIYPDDKVQPFTKNKAAYVRVCVDKVDKIWERVCK